MANFLDRLRRVFGPTHRIVGTAPPRSEADQFVYGGELVFVQSSNVAAAQYHWGEHKMMIEYHGGAAYLYSQVSEDEAWAFITAKSKGGWVWSNLRVRGTVDQHRKPFVRIK